MNATFSLSDFEYYLSLTDEDLQDHVHYFTNEVQANGEMAESVRNEAPHMCDAATFDEYERLVEIALLELKVVQSVQALRAFRVRVTQDASSELGGAVYTYETRIHRTKRFFYGFCEHALLFATMEALLAGKDEDALQLTPDSTEYFNTLKSLVAAPRIPLPAV